MEIFCKLTENVDENVFDPNELIIETESAIDLWTIAGLIVRRKEGINSELEERYLEKWITANEQNTCMESTKKKGNELIFISHNQFLFRAVTFYGIFPVYIEILGQNIQTTAKANKLFEMVLSLSFIIWCFLCSSFGYLKFFIIFIYFWIFPLNSSWFSALID